MFLPNSSSLFFALSRSPVFSLARLSNSISLAVKMRRSSWYVASLDSSSSLKSFALVTCGEENYISQEHIYLLHNFLMLKPSVHLSKIGHRK